jgi:hypothetical protein
VIPKEKNNPIIADVLLFSHVTLVRPDPYVPTKKSAGALAIGCIALVGLLSDPIHNFASRKRINERARLITNKASS